MRQEVAMFFFLILFAFFSWKWWKASLKDGVENKSQNDAVCVLVESAECIKLSTGKDLGQVICGLEFEALPVKVNARSQSKNVLWNSVFSSLCEVFYSL